MSRNPYENVEGAPQLQRSVFVFMDILGYENLTRVAELDRYTARVATEASQRSLQWT